MDKKGDRNGVRAASLADAPSPAKGKQMSQEFAGRSNRAVRILLIIMLSVSILYFGQPVLMPIAMAVLLTLLLSPVVHVLERWRLGRVPSVIVVMITVTGMLLGAGWVVSIQLVGLAQQLTTYKSQLKEKIKNVSPLNAKEGTLQKFRNAVGVITDAVKQETPAPPGIGKVQPDGEHPVDGVVGNGTKTNNQDTDAVVEWLGLKQKPQLVVVVPEKSSNWGMITTALASISGPLATMGVVIILVIFLLIEQEDVRDRLVRLAGTGRLTLTTKTMADIRARISRYLLMNALVNGGYGLAVGIGLLLIGVDYALLWGFLAALFRFVPYLGPIVASLLPIGMSFIQFPGWTGTLITVAFFIVLELVTNNLIEPLAYGRSAGVSIVAILVSALFWAWVWGPIGLALSVPMTVLMAVLGKHVPELQSLGIALGDEPPLESCVTFYQRLLAGDQEEAESLLEEYVKTRPLEEVYDSVLIPALVLAERDRKAGSLTQDQIEFIWNSTNDLLDDLAPPEVTQDAESGEAPSRPAFPFVVGYPAEDTADDLALEMLSKVAGARGVDVQRVSRVTLVSELLESIAAHRPDVVCLSGLGPGGVIQLRYALKRIRRQFPDIKILVGRWGYVGDREKMTARLTERGATHVVRTLAEALEILGRMRPLVSPQELSRRGPVAIQSSGP